MNSECLENVGNDSLVTPSDCFSLSMINTIKAVSVVPINTVPHDSDDDNQERYPNRRITIQYKVDVA